MTIRGEEVDYRSFHQGDTVRELSDTERELLQQQPELQQLYKAVCLMLAGYPQRDRRDPEATLLARLPKLRYSKVSRMSTACRSMQCTPPVVSSLVSTYCMCLAFFAGEGVQSFGRCLRAQGGR